MVRWQLAVVFMVAALVLPAAGAVAGRWGRGGWPCRWLSWAGAVAGMAVLAAVAFGGAQELSFDGRAWLVADPVSSMVLVLVAVIGAVVQSFSARYLLADPGSGRFAARVGVVILGSELVATSADLAGLVVGWSLAGVGFAAALNCRPDLPGVAGCARSVRRSLLIGDGCLVGAAVLVWIRAGDLDLSSSHALASAAHQLGPWHPVVAVLVAVAALARCAQGPFRRWLPKTVSAPTPACALLHGGVVNGGGLLLVRLGAVGAWAPALAGVLVVTTATAVWGALVMAHQADVKGQLASSTMSQMGFMLAECAVGAYPAALIHLVGHGFYKASLFLSSGSAVRRPGGVAMTGPTRTGWRWRPASVVGAVAAAAVLPGVAAGEGAVLAGFAAVTALSIAWGSRRVFDDLAAWRWAVMYVAAAVAYGLGVSALGRFLDGPALPRGDSVGEWAIVVLAVASAAGTLLTRWTRVAPVLRARLLDAGVPSAGWDAVPGRPALSVVRASDVDMLSIARRAA